jgi:hypothetical protein
MADELRPRPGFYYHCKRSQDAEVNDYAYEVIGIAVDPDHLADIWVIYRPLYRGKEPLAADTFHRRPLSEFMGEKLWRGKVVPRFVRIEDPKTIMRLETIKKVLYQTA